MESPSQNQEGICQLCWIKYEHFEVVGENTKDKLDMLLLKIDLVLSEEPVICTNCAERVKNCFAFKSMCLDIYNYIITFVNDKINIKLDLKDICLSQMKNNISISDDHNICGFCMGLVKSCSAISIDKEDEDNMREILMLEKCLPELDVTIIRNPIICALCHGSLEDYYRFLMGCLNLEKKIKKYRGTHNIPNNNIDLINTLHLKLSDILTSKDGNTVDIISEGKSLMNRENNGVVEVKNENFMEMEDHQKFDSLLFKSEDLLGCEEKKVHDVKTEGEFYVEQANEVPQTNESLVKIEDQKCLFNEEIKIKTDQLDLDSFQDDVAESHNNISTHNSLKRKIFKKHKLIQKDDNMVYQCDSCSYQTGSKGCLKSHSLIHKKASQIRMYQCEICVFQTKRKGSLKVHSLLHSDSPQVAMHKCQLCSFRTKRKSYLNTHMLTHKQLLEIRMHQCELCGFQTKTRNNLKSHLLVHKDPSEIVMYQCHSCSYQTKYKHDLKMHILNHRDSSEGTMYRCDSCSYQTRYKNAIEMHVLVHRDSSEVAMYQCDSCSYRTKRKDSLRSHSLVHKDSSEITMYKCDSCPYQTKYKNALKVHSLLHKDSLEGNMYHCNSCSYQTKRKNCLKRHVRIHRETSVVTVQ